jgi:hypothetical protein
MDALLRIRTKDGSEVLKNKLDAVTSKKTKTPKVPKAPKVPKGVSSTKKNGEFAKFTPIQTPNAPVTPAPWDDEDPDELVSAVDLDDDGKFETENDIFIKQDQEWHELMKEADAANNDDASSEVPEDDTSSEANFDDDRSDVSNIDSDLDEGDAFYNYVVKEPRANIKVTKTYSGIPIDFDYDYE